MTYDERAKQVVLDVDTTYSYAQIPEALRPILERAITKELAAIREECAKVAESKAYTTDPYDPGYGYSVACLDVAKAIRTAQPAKAVEWREDRTTSTIGGNIYRDSDVTIIDDAQSAKAQEGA